MCNAKRFFLVVGCALVILQLVGCAGNVKPQASPVIIQSPADEPSIVVEPVIPIAPVAPPVTEPVLQAPTPALTANAVSSLVKQARGQYDMKNYQAAIATAERGLRIDRRTPELYLVLAESYLQLANIQLAQQFLQQGIRYAQAGSEVAQSLSKVREALVK